MSFEEGTTLEDKPLCDAEALSISMSSCLRFTFCVETAAFGTKEGMEAHTVASVLCTIIERTIIKTFSFNFK